MSTAVDVPGYEDLREIGRGGYAVVYKASQLAFNRTVALKVLQRNDLDEDQQRRFAKECQAVGGLSWHPHIVGVYDAGITPTGYAFLAMEFLEDGSLGDRMRRRGPLPWVDVLAIGVQLAGALETAHQAGVIHRDVKPENLLVDHYGEAKLADFGIAAVSGGTQTATGVVTATISHASPEILAGARASVSSDVYALGSTLYTLLVGRPAFWEATDEGVIPLIMRATTMPVPDLRPQGVPDALAAVIEASMAKEAANRPATARELGEALQAIQAAQGLPVTDMRLRRARSEGGDPGPQQTAEVLRPAGPPGPPSASTTPRPPYPATADPAAGPPSVTPATTRLQAAPPAGAPPAGPGLPPPVPPHDPGPEPGPSRGRAFGPALAMLAGAAVVVVLAILVLAIGGGDDDDDASSTTAGGVDTTAPAETTTPPTDAPSTAPPETQAPTTAPPATEAPETTADAGLGDPIGDTGFYVGDDPDHEDVQVDACGVGLCVNIGPIELDDGVYRLTYQPIGYDVEQLQADNHVHFFWDDQDVEDSGTNGTPPGFWVAWPNTDEQLLEFNAFNEGNDDELSRPEDATAICATPANASHQVLDPGNFDCIPLP